MQTKILMVCLGNICRSPLAEGILKSKLPKDKFIVESAGTADWHIGKKPDDRSIATANKNGIDISSQRGRLFKKSDFNNFDYIFVMDNSNFENVIKLAPNDMSKQKVHLILNELFPDENVDVPDPYYGLQNGFDMAFEMLNESCEILTKKLLENHK